MLISCHYDESNRKNQEQNGRLDKKPKLKIKLCIRLKAIRLEASLKPETSNLQPQTVLTDLIALIVS